METRGRLVLIACESGRVFARRVADALEKIVQAGERSSFQGIADTTEVHFANREVKTVLNESVRGSDVYVIQCIDDPESDRSVNDNLMAVLTALGAAQQADADCITAILPQFPYARQERKKAREGITARQVARFIEISGADRVLTIDLHAQAVGGFFERVPLDNLHASKPMLEYFSKVHDLKNIIVVSPDVGSADRARFLSRRLKCDMAICDKERDYSKPGVVRTTRLVGDVRGRDVLMMDDMIATGGSIIEAAMTCRRSGAKDIYLGCTFPFFNGNAVERLDEAYRQGLFKMLLGTDAVYRRPEFARAHPWYREVSVAPLFAQVIHNINYRTSVSRLLQ